MRKFIREYEFRGKRIDNGEWVYGYYLKSGFMFIAVDGGLVDGHWDIFQVDPVTVGQFTGFKDKKGKKIYEGDIFADDFGNGNFYVCWNEDEGFWGVKEHTSCEGGYFLSDVSFDCFWVVGNIHDNPELVPEVGK